MPRHISLPLVPQVKEELKQMEQHGVITKVKKPTKLCAPIVGVVKTYGQGENLPE